MITAIHVDPNAPTWLVFGILGVFVVVGSFFAWRYRRLRNEVFSRHEFEKPSLDEIQARVDAVNREGAPYSFAAERRANIPFRGQRISVVFGPIGWTGWTAHNDKSVFVIADAEQSRWIERVSDVFERAFSGSAFSIFWIDMAKLIREMRRQ